MRLRCEAEELGADIATLIEGGRTARTSVTSDEAKLEAALFHAQVPVHKSALAAAFDWELTRLQAAADALSARLAGTGLALSDKWSKLHLSARIDAISDEEARALDVGSRPGGAFRSIMRGCFARSPQRA